jgi:SnoaL-like domain
VDRPRGRNEPYRGREGVSQRLKGWLESFDDDRYEVQRIIDCGGDEVLVEATEVGRGAASGAEVRTANYELLTIRDGMIVRSREFYDESGPRSRRAAGVGRCRRRTLAPTARHQAAPPHPSLLKRQLLDRRKRPTECVLDV